MQALLIFFSCVIAATLADQELHQCEIPNGDYMIQLEGSEKHWFYDENLKTMRLDEKRHGIFYLSMISKQQYMIRQNIRTTPLDSFHFDTLKFQDINFTRAVWTISSSGSSIGVFCKGDQVYLRLGSGRDRYFYTRPLSKYWIEASGDRLVSVESDEPEMAWILRRISI